MRDCTMNNIDETGLSSSGSTSYAPLTSLTISDCQLSTEDLQMVLQLTPSLLHLKLISFRPKFSSIFDGSYWEQFLQRELPQLHKFEFVLAYVPPHSNDYPSQMSIIAPFRSSFWLDNKQWFVTCDYVLSSARMILYTIPVSMTEYRVLCSFERWMPKTVCRLTCRLVNEIIDTTTEQVCIRVLQQCWKANMFSVPLCFYHIF